MSKVLGERIRHLRRSHNLSQLQLAEGIASASYVSLIEAGRRMPEPKILRAIADRLGTSEAALLEPEIDREHQAQLVLRLRYAELALANGDTGEALRELGDLVQHNSIAADAHWALSRTYEADGRLEDAIGEVELLLDLVRGGTPCAAELLVLLNTHCRLYREVGDLGRSIDIGEAARREVAELGLTGTENDVRLVSTLAGTYWQRGDWASAEVLARQAIDLAEQQGSRRSRGSAYWNASLVAEARGQLGEAIALAERALGLFTEDSDERSIARLRTDLAWIILRAQPVEVTRAEQLLLLARARLAEAGIEMDLAYCDTELARCHLHLGRIEQAAELAADVVRRLGERPILEVSNARTVWAQALAAGGDTAGALAQLDLVIEQLRALGIGRQGASLWREIAELLLSLGETAAAVRAFQYLADASGAVAPAISARRVLV
ncbi:transcriptional regulator with XRE-family HTH domain [Allocatelliglobosispora scoriae]|uniref:Transcriptional regulator with XRE-family HTH domain n=1 Tax=Allocatelliglobosispora scoriae TaxID=643052 RepID=A0A841BMS1_9ACTN|nr:helix-turn-helix transcriptional regulator [Allocatelliglobosispora scoriae]MBB5868965.1 transcriptional regulator with XRE-family HTH domain [Allocatelliglobosispora scoriae]